MRDCSKHCGGAVRGASGRAHSGACSRTNGAARRRYTAPAGRGHSVLSEVKIRRARPADKAGVLNFCRRTWGEYGDFIHRVWDEWIGDKRGFYAVALLGDRPIGTAKLTLLRPGEVWFEGLRVDRQFRGIGLAHVLTEFLLKKAARMNAKSVRYATGGSNLASQHIGKMWGFRLLRRYICMEAPPDGRRKAVLIRVSDPAKVLRLAGAGAAKTRAGFEKMDSAAGGKTGQASASAVARLTHVLSSSRFVTSMKGLASEGWTFYQVDEDFVRRALRRRGVYVALTDDKGLPDDAALPQRSATHHSRAVQSGAGPSTAPDPAAVGFLVASAQHRRGRLLVWTLADLKEDCFPVLLGAARRLAFDLGLKEVRVVMPYARVMTIPARRMGFHREYEGMSSVVMEQLWGPERSSRERPRRGRSVR